MAFPDHRRVGPRRGPSFNDRWQDSYRGSRGYSDAGTHRYSTTDAGSYGELRGGGEQAREAGGFRGRGPKGYRRSDERIREDVCELLTADSRVDASNIEVRAENGEVTLSGTVRAREDKRLAEDLAETVTGVRDVHNRLSVEVAP
jgi:osmotically-inducible protein OsmY